MTRSSTRSTARKQLGAARSSLRSALGATVMSVRIAVVTLMILTMTATALVFGSQGPASANEPLATEDSPAEDPTLGEGTAAESGTAIDDATPAAALTGRSVTDKETRAVTAKMLLAREMAFIRARIVEVARKQIGDTYVPGASGPHSFDCSGLTRFVYEQAADISLPHYSRAQFGEVKRIPRAEAKPGDLVFFLQGSAHHVGIYIGNGKMIDAPGVGKPVRVSPTTGSWWGRTFTGMGRVLPA